jgi:cis-L-3-hydroxyproline dehydratase
MKIVRVEVYGYDLHYAQGSFVMSDDRIVTSLPSTVVKLVTDSGEAGWGEVCPLGAAYLPAFAAGARAALHEIAPALLGLDPCNLGVINGRMDAVLRGHNYAKSPVDVACWDLLGKVTNCSISTLLGGVFQAQYPIYVPVSLGSAEEMAKFVVAKRAEGVRQFQLKVGDDPHGDKARVERVLAVTDERDTIIADANGGWTLQEAVVAARLLDGFPRVYLEQPCASLEECLHVRRHTTLPMILDEVITDARSLVAAHREGGMEAINLKISRVGGLTRARLIRDLAQDLGLRLTIEDSWGGDIVTAAISHLAASTTSRALFTVSFTNDAVTEHVAGFHPRAHHGIGAVPDGPGLGVEVANDLLGQPIFTISERAR